MVGHRGGVCMICHRVDVGMIGHRMNVGVASGGRCVEDQGMGRVWSIQRMWCVRVHDIALSSAGQDAQGSDYPQQGMIHGAKWIVG